MSAVDLRRALLALLAVPFFFLAGCNGPDFECSEEIPCSGFGEICTDGVCMVETCSSNLDCPMESTCQGNTCNTGCDSDRDCYPGDQCNLDDGVCETRGCTDTHLDCGYKEFCNTLTGECYDAGGVYCRPCDPRNVVEDCNGGNGNGPTQCWNNFCTVDCSNGRECPSGFQCYPFTDRAGNVLTWQCLTYCWLYEDNSAGDPNIVGPPPWEDPIVVQQSECDPADATLGGQ